MVVSDRLRGESATQDSQPKQAGGGAEGRQSVGFKPPLKSLIGVEREVSLTIDDIVVYMRI